MVNMKVNKSNISLSISGSLEDIVSEILYGIQTVHERFKEQDKDAASAFEATMKMGLLHVFNPDEAEEFLDELLEHLDDDDEDDDDFIEKMIAKMKKAKRK